jgi:iron complex outermembrane receptor protein
MKLSRAFALATVSVLSLATPAMAQQADNTDEDSATGPIIVEARRKDEDIQDVPLVVQAVTSQELQKLNIRDFQDVQKLVPGLSLGQSSNGIGAQASLRGIAFDVNASGNNGTIEFYQNDAPLSAGILFQGLFDVGQIEVLRGPQGTLRGRASPSGSITVTTKKPVLDAAGGYMQGTANTIGGWNFNGAINVPVIKDILGVRVAGMVDESEDNRVHSVNNTAEPFNKNKGGRVSVLFRPIDDLSIFFAYTVTNRKVQNYDQLESMSVLDSTAAASPVLIRATDRKSYAWIPRTYTQDFQVYNWQAEYKLAGQRLNYVGSVNKQHYTAFGPNDSAGFFNPVAAYSAIIPTGQSTDTRGTQQNHEVRLSSDERIAGMFDYVVGYMWNKLESPTNLTSQTPLFAGFFVPQNVMPALITPTAILPPGGPLPTPSLAAIINTPVTRGGYSIDESVFGNLTMHIGDATELSGGVRHIKYTSTGFLTISGAPVAAANENRVLKTTIWSASLKHRFNDNLMAYASFGTSWRPGSGTNPIILRDNVSPTPALAALYFPKDEKSKSYEVGIKSDWFDKKLRFNLTAYHQDFDNFAYSARNVFYGGVNSSGANTVFTAGPAIAVGVPAKVDGIEAELAYAPSSNFNLAATLAYAKSKIKNASVPCNDYFPKDGTPDTVSTVPTYAQINTATNGANIAFCNVNYRAGNGAPFSATLQGEYSLPVMENSEAYLRGFVNYQGKSLNDPANSVDDIKAYALANLYLGVRDPGGSWDITLFAKNLFNTEIVTSRSQSPSTVSYTQLACRAGVPGCPTTPSSVTYGQVATSTYRAISMTAPREFGITARFAIGSR